MIPVSRTPLPCSVPCPAPWSSRSIPLGPWLGHLDFFLDRFIGLNFVQVVDELYLAARILSRERSLQDLLYPSVEITFEVTFVVSIDFSRSLVSWIFSWIEF